MEVALDSKPRKLTTQEIDDVLSIVPDILSASKQVSEINSKSIRATLREQLQNISITSLGLQDLKDEIISHFNQSKVRPGESAGILAAEAAGKQITQTTLDSFHQSGSAKNVSYGIRRITEMINASKTKRPAVTIYFKDQNLSFDDIMTNKRPEITEMKVSDLVKTDPDIDNIENFSEPWWYQPYRLLIRDDFESKYVMRLKLDVNMMYAYKITMEDVCKAIEIDQSVICVYSPMEIGYIDIYPIEKRVAGELKSKEILSRENASMVFLYMIVVPALDKLTIQGVPGIRKIYLVDAPVWQIVKEEKRIPDYSNGWYIILNPIRMKYTGIGVDKLISLLKVVGIKILKIRPNYVGVETDGGISPTKLVNDAITLDQEEEKAYEARKKEEGARVVRRPPTSISTAYKLQYVDTDGSNMLGLFARTDVDSTRTYSSDVHEIYDVLGIEAARTFYIKEFITALGFGGSYINPRHVVLLVDYMTSLGIVSGITYTGITRHNVGALAKASVVRAMDAFEQAGAYGETKEIVGVSASLYVGKKALIGTGYSEKFMDTSNFDQLRKKLNEDPKYKVDSIGFNEAVSDFNQIVFGADQLDVAEAEMFSDYSVKFDKGEPKKTSQILPASSMPPPPQLGKGPMIRGKALEEAAANLTSQPFRKAVTDLGSEVCRMPQPQTTMHVEAIRSPVSEVPLPSIPSLPSVEPLPTVPSIEESVQFSSTDPGLPQGLFQQMQKFSVSSPPTQPQMPVSMGLPSPGTPLPSIPEEVPETTQRYEEKKEVPMFSLDDFMG